MTKIQLVLLLLIASVAEGQVRIKSQYIVAGDDTLGVLPSIRLSSAETSVRLDGLTKDWVFDLNGISFNEYLAELSNEKETPFYPIRELDFQTVYNKDSIVSFQISYLGCSAYCETYVKLISIDAKRGKILQLKELLTEEGSERFLKELNYFKRKNVKKHLKRLKAKKLTNPADKSENAEKIVVFENCTTELKAFDEIDFLIDGDSIIVQFGRCSTHANQVLDELGRFTYKEAVSYYNEFYTEEGWGVFYPSESFEEFSFKNMILKFLFGVVLILVIGARFIFWARKRVKELDEKETK